MAHAPYQSVGKHVQASVSSGLGLPQFFVSYISQSRKDPVLLNSAHPGAKIPVQVDDAFKVGDKLMTNDARVELRDHQGMILRLGSNSEVE
jgi:hypothetical protein